MPGFAAGAAAETAGRKRIFWRASAKLREAHNPRRIKQIPRDADALKDAAALLSSLAWLI
jgi:hypothetical protein